MLYPVRIIAQNRQVPLKCQQRCVTPGGDAGDGTGSGGDITGGGIGGIGGLGSQFVCLGLKWMDGLSGLWFSGLQRHWARCRMGSVLARARRCQTRNRIAFGSVASRSPRPKAGPNGPDRPFS